MGRKAKTTERDPDMTYYRLLRGKHYKRNRSRTSVNKGLVRYEAGGDNGLVPYGPGERHPEPDGVRWELADGAPAPKAEPAAEEFTGAYELSPRGGAWFDVVNKATGETINTSALREDAALEMIAGYEADPPEQEEDEEPDPEPDVDEEEE